ncbi:hypothetical protein Tco_1402671 [Tanacetum coccineum]
MGGTSSLSTGKPLTQEEAEREALAIDICRRYSLLEEERPVIKTKANRTRQRGGNGCKKRNNNVEPLKGRACEASEGYPVPEEFCTPVAHPKHIERITYTFDGIVTKLGASSKTILDTSAYLNCKDDPHGSISKAQPLQAANSRYNTKLAQLLPRLIYSPCVVDWNVLNQMSYGEAIDEIELCHEFYSTYEFDKVCAADELRTKKIIKFRLFGYVLRSMSISPTLKSIVSEAIVEKKILVCQGSFLLLNPGTKFLRYFEARQIIKGYENVAVLIRGEKMKGGCTRNEKSMICCGTDFGYSTLEELIELLEDLYERVGNMEIRQGAIERMSYRQSYHWDRYAGVFEHMAKVYSVPHRIQLTLPE